MAARSWGVSAGLATWLAAAAPAGAQAPSPAGATLSCAGELASQPEGRHEGARLSFEARLPGGDGDMLGLVDEQTGQVLRLLYDGEVGAGALTLAGASGRELVWTRGKANGGDFLGLAIDAAGEIATLRIDARPSAAAGRAFALFLTERSALYRGFCDKAP